MSLDSHIRVYLSEEDKARVKKQAQKRGLKPSSWIRSLIKKELPREATA